MVQRPEWTVIIRCKIPGTRWSGLSVQFFDLASEADNYVQMQLINGASYTKKRPYNEELDQDLLHMSGM